MVDYTGAGGDTESQSGYYFSILGWSDAVNAKGWQKGPYYAIQF